MLPTVLKIGQYWFGPELKVEMGGKYWRNMERIFGAISVEPLACNWKSGKTEEFWAITAAPGLVATYNTTM